MHAAIVLSGLAQESACRALLVAGNALPALVTLLSIPGTAEEAALSVLQSLSTSSDRTCAGLIDIGALPHFVGLLSRGIASACIRAVLVLAAVAGSSLRGAAAVEDAGALPPLVALLAHGGPGRGCAAEAALALQRLACTNGSRARIVLAGALGPLVALLAPPHGLSTVQDIVAQALRLQAAATLAELAIVDDGVPAPGMEAELPANAMDFVAAGVLPPILALMSGGTPESQAQAAKVLCWLASRRSAHSALVEAGVLPALVAQLHSGPTGRGRASAAGALRYMAGTRESRAAIESAVPRGLPGRESLLKSIHTYCF